MASRKTKKVPSNTELTKDDIINALFELQQKSSILTENDSMLRSPDISMYSKKSKEILTEIPDQEGLDSSNQSKVITSVLEISKDKLNASHLKNSTFKSTSTIKQSSPSKTLVKTVHNTVRTPPKRSISPINDQSSIRTPPKRNMSPINEIINRLYRASPEKEHQLTALRLLKLQKEMKNLRPSPEMSPGSRKMTEGKTTKPIYKRSPDIIKQKEEKYLKMYKLKEEKERELSPSYNVSMYMQSTSKWPDGSRARSPKELVNDFMQWQAKKKALQQAKQIEKIVKDSTELSFSPKLNKSSRQLNQKPLLNETVEHRLLRRQEEAQERAQILIQKHTPNFKPILNSKTQMICKQNEDKRTPRGNFSKMYLNTDISARSLSPAMRNRTPK